MIYEIKDLCFSYPTSEKPVLSRLNLNVGECDIVAILGRNGTGKSTLLNCMLGLLKPQSGSILLSGKDIKEMNERQIASVTGYVPQTYIASFGYSVIDYVLMGCASRIGLFSKPGKSERQDAQAALSELRIEDLADKPYTEISGGERQKAAIARAIVSSPKVVLFDAPTAHLDYGSQLLVLRIIKELSQKGYSVVITTHNPDHALLLGGKAALMDENGSLITGSVDQVITQENLSRIYQADVRLEYIKSVNRKACVYSNL
jgi:iron complex transport system ATP-binding protein